MLEDRRLEVLRAIVEDYVATQEPVGSRALVERHALGVSSATVRNDMAALEDEGYIMQPHTSAGRIPTTRGYRLFVDRLTAVKPLSAAERRAIEAFLAGPVNLDDVVARTVRLLAQLTRQAAVVQYPVLTRSSVTHVELVALSTTRLMVVVITSTGRVDQRVVEVPDTTDVAGLGELRAAINARLGGRRFAEVPALLDDLAPAAPQPDATPGGAARLDGALPDAAGHDPVNGPAGVATPLTRVVVDTLRDMLVEQRDTRVVLAGTANLAHLSDFQGSLTAVLEALEEHVVLMRLLGEASAGSGVTVRIGDETRHEGLRGASLVSAAYGPHGESVGALGVLGPVRMDYPGTMGAVRAVARYLGRILTEG